ncbi:hypothetical protein IWX46DRAFT_354085 [Phyllosticta citricarpa]|uniref:Secreted protein n=1 Tax=Phyllosticta citricarpa TaxID=55181 RepID=A0ABR1LDG5_9PEZI
MRAHMDGVVGWLAGWLVGFLSGVRLDRGGGVASRGGRGARNEPNRLTDGRTRRFLFPGHAVSLYCGRLSSCPSSHVPTYTSRDGWRMATLPNTPHPQRHPCRIKRLRPPGPAQPSQCPTVPLLFLLRRCGCCFSLPTLNSTRLVTLPSVRPYH